MDNFSLGIPPIPYGLKAKHTQPESVVISWSSSDQYLFYIKPDNYTVEITSDGSDTRRIPVSNTFKLL